MLLIPQFVNGGELSVQKSSATATLESVIQRLLSHGEDEKFSGNTRFPRIIKNSPTREEWAFPKASEDHHRRYIAAILDRSTGTAKTATHVEFFVARKDKAARKGEEIYFLTGLDGTLLEAGFAVGPLDEKGKSIPGPALAPFKYFDITSPETRALFQRELDFWVKGVGRKAPVPPAKGSGAKPSEKPGAGQREAP